MNKALKIGLAIVSVAGVIGGMYFIIKRFSKPGIAEKGTSPAVPGSRQDGTVADRGRGAAAETDNRPGAVKAASGRG